MIPRNPRTTKQGFHLRIWKVVIMSLRSPSRWLRIKRAVVIAMASFLTVGGIYLMIPSSASNGDTAIPSTWTNVTSFVGTPPSARSDASMVYDAADGYTVLFGGENSSGALGDTWIFNGSKWSELPASTAPSPRYAASMVYDTADGYVLLFGGLGCGGECNDTWEFKAGTWTELFPTQSPSARGYAAMTYDAGDGYVLLFGGGNGGSTVFGDTWTFEAGHWTPATPNDFPSAREAAYMTDDLADGYVVMFSGTANATCICQLSDTWEYSGGNWKPLTPSRAPSSRDDYSLVYDPAISAVLFFGGWNANGACGNTTDDTWEFDGGNWTELPPTSSPSARSGAAMDYDPNVGGAVLFGGTNGTCRGVTPMFLSDTWLFGGTRLATPASITVAATPSTLSPGQRFTVSGQVTDSIGIPLPGVQVEVNVSGNTLLYPTTNSNGDYSATTSLIYPGPYSHALPGYEYSETIQASAPAIASTATASTTVTVPWPVEQGAWAGYSTLQPVFSIFSSWKVPATTSATGESAQWIGIGGTYGDPLIQVGTYQGTPLDVNPYCALTPPSIPPPVDSYYCALFETTPKYDQPVFFVSPGDEIAASITETSESPTQNPTCGDSYANAQNDQTWVIQIADTSSNSHQTETCNYDVGGHQTGDWIVEAPQPTLGPTPPLASFGSATFVDAVANSEPGLMTDVDSWDMDDPNGGKAAPSAPSFDGESFTVCYGAATYEQCSLSSPLAVVTTSLPDGTIGHLYPTTTLSANGGNAPYTWKLVPGSGKLPKGLKLNKRTGVISGTPKKTARSSSFTVEVLDKKIKVKHHHATQNSSTEVLSITIL